MRQHQHKMLLGRSRLVVVLLLAVGCGRHESPDLAVPPLCDAMRGVIDNIIDTGSRWTEEGHCDTEAATAVYDQARRLIDTTTAICFTDAPEHFPAFEDAIDLVEPEKIRAEWDKLEDGFGPFRGRYPRHWIGPSGSHEPGSASRDLHFELPCAAARRQRQQPDTTTSP